MSNWSERQSYIKVTVPKKGDVWIKNHRYIVRWQVYFLPDKWGRLLLLNGTKEVIYIISGLVPLKFLKFKWRIPLQIRTGWYYIRLQTYNKKISADSMLFKVISYA
jgi:hypothetical protein